MRKKTWLGILAIIIGGACYPDPILAVTLGVTLNGSATQSISLKASGTWTSTANWTVTGAANCKEDITASVAATGWTYEQVTKPYGDVAAANAFVLRLNNSSGTIINDGSAHTIITDLGYNSASSAFNFYLVAPATGTTDAVKDIVITLTATNGRGFLNDTRSFANCTADGGTVVDAGGSDYYVCKFTGTNVSCTTINGHAWTQYATCQQYSSLPNGAGDACGRFTAGYGPTSFANSAQGVYVQSSCIYGCNSGVTTTCAGYTGNWHNTTTNVPCYEDGYGSCGSYLAGPGGSNQNTATGRSAIGCY